MASMVVLQLEDKKGIILLKIHKGQEEMFLKKNEHIPVSCGLGQFVLRFPVMCVQAQHEASSTQLSL